MKDGDEHAFRVLVEKYKNYVFRTVFAILRNEKDAEDAAQEAFIKIYYALPQYESQGFKTWITRIAINHAIDTKRKLQRFHESGIDTTPYEQIASPEESVVIPLLRKEQRHIVRNRLKELPKGYQDLIYDYYICEKSYKQIAIEKKLEIKTIETKLYRARSWMRKHWKEDDF